MRETESVHKLHSIVNRNYLQQVGLVSSRQLRKWFGRSVRLHFPRFPPNEWIWRGGLLPSNEIDVLKQIQAFVSMSWLAASSCPDSHPPTTQTSIFAKSHLKKWLFSLSRGVLQACILYYKLVLQDLLSFKVVGRRPLRGMKARISRLGWGVLKIPMIGKWPPLDILIDFKSSELSN